MTNRWASREEAREAITVDNHPRLKQHTEWSYELADRPIHERIAYLFSRGMGSVLLQDTEDGYVVDLTHLSAYKVRRGYDRYGVHVLLDRVYCRPIFVDDIPWHSMTGSQKVIAYNRIMSTVFLYVTIVLHAKYLHMQMSPDMVKAARRYERDLPWMKVFAFRTREINAQAFRVLLNKGGIIDRMFALKRSELLRMLREETPRINLTVEVPANKVILAYQMAMRSCPVDNVTADLMTAVTALHEHLGTMGMYLMCPSLLQSKLHGDAPDAKIETKRDTYMNVYACMLTSASVMPMLVDVKEVSDALRGFETLRELCEREQVPHLTPDMLESSISL